MKNFLAIFVFLLNFEYIMPTTSEYSSVYEYFAETYSKNPILEESHCKNNEESTHVAMETNEVITNNSTTDIETDKSSFEATYQRLKHDFEVTNLRSTEQDKEITDKMLDDIIYIEENFFNCNNSITKQYNYSKLDEISSDLINSHHENLEVQNDSLARDFYKNDESHASQGLSFTRASKEKASLNDNCKYFNKRHEISNNHQNYVASDTENYLLFDYNQNDNDKKFFYDSNDKYFSQPYHKDSTLSLENTKEAHNENVDIRERNESILMIPDSDVSAFLHEKTDLVLNAEFGTEETKQRNEESVLNLTIDQIPNTKNKKNIELAHSDPHTSFSIKNDQPIFLKPYNPLNSIHGGKQIGLSSNPIYIHFQTIEKENGIYFICVVNEINSKNKLQRLSSGKKFRNSINAYNEFYSILSKNYTTTIVEINSETKYNLLFDEYIEFKNWAILNFNIFKIDISRGGFSKLKTYKTFSKSKRATDIINLIIQIFESENYRILFDIIPCLRLLKILKTKTSIISPLKIIKYLQLIICKFEIFRYILFLNNRTREVGWKILSENSKFNETAAIICLILHRILFNVRIPNINLEVLEIYSFFYFLKAHSIGFIYLLPVIEIFCHRSIVENNYLQLNTDDLENLIGLNFSKEFQDMEVYKLFKRKFMEYIGVLPKKQYEMLIEFG
ncbi:hypothetical protein H312_02507 [Anncaliia algerae PRA339]|uniref:Uncharacterized protein n=1 Tax=Anncaliia algerae PRA339 TaxID=1288291 RepID=A0A059EYL0_9MICR|nr:hypothetical protein H312_02507 [Anncaliia algerae PRA339]